MKTRRYKFDELWLTAIKMAALDDEERAISQVNAYLEADEEPVNPESRFISLWILIKARIDERKRRNARARQRRGERRGNTGNSDTADKPDNLNNLKDSKQITTATSSATFTPTSPAAAPLSRQKRRILSDRPRFSDRFRGPGSPRSIVSQTSV